MQVVEPGNGRAGGGDDEIALLDARPVGGAESEWDSLNNPGTIYSTVTDPSRLTLWVRTNDGADRPFVELDLADRLSARDVSAAA